MLSKLPCDDGNPLPSSSADSRPRNGNVVVAIDFGTTRTALACTIVGQSEKLINVLSPGKAGSFVHGDLKTATSLLMEGDKAIAFGYKAEEKFAQGGDENPQWRLFSTFKMELYKASKPDPEVQSVGNRGSLPLSRLLMESLKCVKEYALEELKGTSVLRSGDPHDVVWVLTVPAIWNDFSKSMMRKAAHGAGLIPHENSDNLMLALEPECAAIASQMWGAGTRFMIADCGGGTLDITTHEVIQSSPLKLKEVACPAGGPFGAKQVDGKFLEFISKFLGKERYDQLAKKHAAEHFELCLVWEKKKVQFDFDPIEDEWTEINFSSTLDALDLTSKDLMAMVETWNFLNPTATVKCARKGRRKVSLSLHLMKSFFAQTVTSALDAISSAAKAVDGLKYVVFAGGFGKCSLIRSGMAEALKNSSITVIHAKEPDLCIVKGAAMFGSGTEELIASRKSKYTFGISSSTEFDPKIDRHVENSRQKYLSADGKQRLDIFSVHGYVGDDLACHDLCSHMYSPITEKQDIVAFSILITEKNDVFLDNEPGISTLCKTSVNISDMMELPFDDRGIWVKFSFGGPEVRCLVFDHENKKELHNIKVDFQFMISISEEIN